MAIREKEVTDKSKISAVVLQPQWADEVGSIIKPYLLPTSASLNNFTVLYAWEVIYDGPFLVVKPEVEDGQFQPAISIPLGAIITIFEANKETLSARFVREDSEVSEYGLGHLIKGA